MTKGRTYEIWRLTKERESIRQDTNNSDKQKQEVLVFYQIAIPSPTPQTSKLYLKWLMDHFNGYVCNKMKMSTPSLSPILIFVIYDKSDSKEKEGEGEEGEKQN